MKKKIRGFLAGTILSSVLFIILGVLFIIFPLKIDGTLYLILFSALLILGGGQVIFFLRRDKKNMARNSELVIGPALFLAAFFIYFRWAELSSLAQYIFAFLIAVSGFRKLQNALQLKYLDEERWALLLIAAAAGAVYGGVLLFLPFADGLQSALLLRLLGSGFIYSGVSDIAASIWLSVRLREKRLEDKLQEKKNDDDSRSSLPTEQK